MKILHCVTDDKFIDGAIALYDKDTRVENTWVHFVKENSCHLVYVKSTRVMICNIDKFDMLLANVDVVILHSLPSLPIENILAIPKNIKVVWYAWGYDMYDGWNPLIPLKLYLPKTLEIYKAITKAPTPFKALKRKIKELIYKNQYVSILQRIDYFSGVFPYEYSLIKKKYSRFRAIPLDYYYASPDFFIKDTCPTDMTNNFRNIMIGNSANITNNHADVLEFVNKYVNLSKQDKIILPLSYGGPQEYINIVKEIASSTLGAKATIVPLESYLPIDEYWDLASNCRIAIYAHVRQQASDNIFYQIMIGAKVYFTNKSQAYEYLKSIGLLIYSMEDDYATINTGLTIEEIMHNRKILTNYYSASTHIERMKNINSILIDKK